MAKNSRNLGGTLGALAPSGPLAQHLTVQFTFEPDIAAGILQLAPASNDWLTRQREHTFDENYGAEQAFTMCALRFLRRNIARVSRKRWWPRFWSGSSGAAGRKSASLPLHQTVGGVDRDAYPAGPGDILGQHLFCAFKRDLGLADAPPGIGEFLGQNIGLGGRVKVRVRDHGTTSLRWFATGNTSKAVLVPSRLATAGHTSSPGGFHERHRSPFTPARIRPAGTWLYPPEHVGRRMQRLAVRVPGEVRDHTSHLEANGSV